MANLVPKQWVLVRGIMSEAFHWWDFLPQLQARFPQDQFHTADILGNGRHHQHSTPLNLKKNIHALREQVPAEGKKILLGFSLGGMLSLEWAHHHPDEVEAVILINCSLNNSPVYKRITPYSLKQIFHSSLQKDISRREEMIIRMTTSGIPQERIEQVASHWGPRGVEYPVKPINFLWQLFLAAQVPQRPTPPAPVLVLSSGKDKVVHPECSQKIAEVWNLPLVRHPEAGHDLTLEDPQWVLEQVERFVRR
ncbi:alpha/beta hydrolase [Bdellovibrio sp. PAP01]|uniref:Alpha/beta hydrolase n=1 Tax=Bdellovibrio svalbardensis TaxID=2972972 RepID=A0ABT6DQD2_9BACT|nr:alpha/beta hydrolase [Bdellovibrio svalbardensis]